MSKIIDIDLRNGSLIEGINGEVLTAKVNGKFVRSDKGLAWSTKNIINSAIKTAAVDNPNYVFTDGDFTIVWDFFLRPGSYNNSWSGISFSNSTYSTGFIITTNRLVTQTTDLAVLTNSFVAPKSNMWHQIVITHDISTKTIITYIDGVEASFDDYSTVGNGIMKTNYGFIEINEYSIRYFDGDTSRVIVYDTALNEKERAKEYSNFLRSFPITRAVKDNLDYPALKPHDLSHLSASNNGGIGLVAAYNMIPSGETLVDISGEGKDGTIVGAVSSKDGMKFNGSSDEIDLGLDINVSESNPITISIRFNIYDVSAGIIISNYINSSDRFSVNILAGVISARFWNTSSIGIRVGNINAFQWYNLVYTWDGVSVSAMYINGITQTGTSGGGTGLASINNLRIGSRNGTDTFLNGEIADLQIFNYALSAQQAVDYHNQFAKQIIHKDRLALDFGVGDSI